MKIRQNFIDNMLCLRREKSYGSIRFECIVKYMSMQNLQNVLIICMYFAFINFYSGHEYAYVSWDKLHMKFTTYSSNVIWFHLYPHAMRMEYVWRMACLLLVMYVQIVTFMLKCLIWRIENIWLLSETCIPISSFDQTQMLLYIIP